MNRTEFMEELKKLLADLPQEEREEAVSYYEEYFTDAGIEREAETLEELGSPERVAATIRENLYGGEESGGVYTETGYYRSTKRAGRQELTAATMTQKGGQETTDSVKQSESEGTDGFDGRADERRKRAEEKEAKSNNKALLIALLLLGAVPIGICAVLAVCVAISILAVLFGAVIAIVAITGTFLLVGVILAGVGIAHLFSVPPEGLLLCGIGFLFFGAGLLGLLATVFICGQLLPMTVKGIARFGKSLFQRKERTA